MIIICPAGLLPAPPLGLLRPWLVYLVHFLFYPIAFPISIMCAAGIFPFGLRCNEVIATTSDENEAQSISRKGGREGERSREWNGVCALRLNR